MPPPAAQTQSSTHKLRNSFRSLFAAVTVAAITISTAATEAATVGYWNFEAETFANADVGPNSLTLNTAGTGTTRVASPFTNPIPQTDAPNEWAASFDGSGNLLTQATGTTLNVQSFTIEAFIFADASPTDDNMYISSRWLASNGQRSWALGRATRESNTPGGTQNGLYLLVSGDGNETHIVGSGFVLDEKKQYYVAASFDHSSNTDDVTFYIQNLTDGGSLQSVTFSSGRTTVNNPSNSPVQIGSFSTSSGLWNGLIDEVRLSNTVLSENQLLIVPEPSAYAMIGGLLAFGLVLLRRQRR